MSQAGNPTPSGGGVDLERAKAEAAREFAEEEHRKAVEREKERLRLRKSFWVRLFPWRIRIERRDWDILSRDEKVARAARFLVKQGVRVREQYGMYYIERS